MARYLTINSKFNPITFEERMKPLLLYKEEYEKQEEALNKMADTFVAYDSKYTMHLSLYLGNGRKGKMISYLNKVNA